MARTIKITDDDSPISAQLRITSAGGQPRVLSVLVECADQDGVTRADIMAALDGILPPSPVRAKAEIQPPPAATPPQDFTRTPRPLPGRASTPATSSKPRVYRPAPADDRLLAAYVTHSGSPKAMGAYFKVPDHTITSWLNGLRRRRVELPVINRSGKTPETTTSSTGD